MEKVVPMKEIVALIGVLIAIHVLGPPLLRFHKNRNITTDNELNQFNSVVLVTTAGLGPAVFLFSFPLLLQPPPLRNQ